MAKKLKIGGVIKDVRVAAGLSQKELAEEAGLHIMAISMLERDVRSPSLDTVFKLSRALGITPSDFVARVDKANRHK